MTQLVELQRHLGELEEAGFVVYAVTYDPQEALARFADEHDITYQLLSDEDSAVIRRFGILNTLIDPDDEMRHPATGQRFYGIPFPGTYITDGEGVVAEKYFFRHYANRVSAGTILDTSLGEVFVHDESPHQEAREQMATLSAFLADPALRLEVTSTLWVRIETEEGFHIYAEPLPEGFVPTTVEVGPVEGLRIGEPDYPPTHLRAFPELGVTLPVYEERAEIAAPVTATAGLLDWGRDDRPSSVTIPVAITYQACSETVCYRPRSAELRLEVPLAELVRPDYGR